ncbi:Zinc finger BED domain-containing protein 1, partial [Cyphomyrmex costatus]
NIVKAVINSFELRKHLPCFAHTINLIVTDSIKASSELKMIVDKIKAIVTFFKHSVNASDELRKLQVKNGIKEGAVLKLKQECETRWNSMYYMLSRFLQLTQFISMILIRYSKPDMLMQSEIQIAKEIMTILSPLEKITVEMSGDRYVTCSKIIPIVNCLVKTMEKSLPVTEPGKILHKNIQNQIIKRFYSDGSNIEKNDFLTISTMLDPRFKKLHFRNPLSVSITIEKISKLMKVKDNVAANTTKPRNRLAPVVNDDNTIWNIHDELASSIITDFDEPGGVPVELRQFLNRPIIQRTDDPLTHWYQVKAEYPKLYKIAIKYLTIVATSVPSERLFSKAGNILTEKRSRLSGARLCKLIFLSSLDENYWQNFL